MKDENLNEYKSAYYPEFKFNDENKWYLTQYAKYLANTLNNNKSQSILSLGIGHNVVSDKIISLLGSELKIYDIVEGSLDIINEFKEKNGAIKNLNVYHSYFEVFESDRQYDAIEMGFVLEHVDDPELVINHFKKKLKPNGVIFISVPNARSLHRVIGHKAGLLESVYELSEYDYQLGHKRYFDIDKAISLIEGCGLKVEDKKGLMLKPITGAQMNELKWGENIIDALFDIGEDYPEIANCMYFEAIKCNE
jgi:2-polyprenyl-3-methyl-5-hydroxy-6-metoxy-1,4-benzoquinol methylase